MEAAFAPIADEFIANFREREETGAAICIYHNGKNVLDLIGGSYQDESVQVVHHDAEAAVRAAQTAGGTAVLCSPMTPGEVYAVAARGEKVPRKSTSFAPKPRTGLVLRSFALG